MNPHIGCWSHITIAQLEKERPTILSELFRKICPSKHRSPLSLLSGPCVFMLKLVMTLMGMKFKKALKRDQLHSLVFLKSGLCYLIISRIDFKLKILSPDTNVTASLSPSFMKMEVMPVSYAYT